MVADNVTRVAEPDGVIVYEILLVSAVGDWSCCCPHYCTPFPQSEPVCTCQVALAGTTLNCTTSGSTARFRVGQPFLNRFLTSTVTLRNGVLSSTSPPLNISEGHRLTCRCSLTGTGLTHAGTHDVDAIAVSTTSGPNAVQLSASYVGNSPARGALFMLLFNDEDGTVDYARSVYLV